MPSSNPAFKVSAFTQAGRLAATGSDQTMTLQGAVNKTGLLLFLAFIPASWIWNTNPSSAGTWMLIGLIGGLVFGLITAFKAEWAPVTAPVYAVLEGLFLGGISLNYEAAFPGIVIQAVGLTFGTFFCLLLAYKSGLIRATENFKLGVSAAVGGIVIVYLVSMVLRLFGSQMPYIHGSGIVGIGFSLFVVIVAALTLVLDFDFVEESVRTGAPKYMEWYAAYALMVSLVWLYLEILRLLAKLRSRD